MNASVTSTIRFLLDGELVELGNFDPTRSVLQYLREDRLRTGTKEGCAEGDCGACTVVIGEVINERMQFRAVNACIQFLPTLDGKMLFTVESLKSAAGELHPVQQSLVDYHASQCGFCTPGFVMSMFALYKNEASITREIIDDTLSGNLCRCTGYKPIIEAALRMRDYTPSDPLNPLVYAPAGQRDDASEQVFVDQLKAIQAQRGIEIEAGGRRLAIPVTVAQLAALCSAYPDACLLAGGTDIGLWVTKLLRDLEHVIYLGNIPELKQIEVTETDIEIGAAVTLTDAFVELSKSYAEFDEMFRRFASVPVRNAGTLVGNIANGSPIGDSMPALISIGARVKLRQGEATRELPLQELYLDYQKNALRRGEFVQAVIVPKRDATLRLRCYKLSKRFDQDISAVCASFALRLDGERVASLRMAFGGVAAIPQRAFETEQLLTGKSWDEQSVIAAMRLLRDEFTPLSDMRASANYRKQATANLLWRFYLETKPQNPLASEAVNVFAVGS